MLSALLKIPAVLLFSVLCLTAAAQQSVCTLEGYVTDHDNGSPLPGATIYIKTLAKGTTTNEQGFYTLSVPAGKHVVTFSFVGYESDSVTVDLQKATQITSRLKPVSTTISEVTISAQKEDEKLTQTETGLITLQKKDIENLPYLLGEIDPVRIIQLMPGIHTSGEGSTGFYVRGGAVDQNLMVLDHSTVYNPSHLFGFFSIFNGSTIKSIDLYKSGIPSYHGGRLSSVTNITTRPGSNQQFKGEGSIGLIATNVQAEGPLKKNKGSFLVAARRTYVDLFAQTLRDLSILKQDINYYFYDLNVNADYRISSNDNISFRGYLGNDAFRYSTSSSFKNNIQWKNTTGSVRWQHTFRNGLYTDLVVGTSLYDMNFGASINTYLFKVASDIHDNNVLYQFNLKKGKHDLAWGVNYIHHTLRPNNINAYSEDIELDIGPKVKLQADEGALFLNDKIQLSDKVEVSAGIRLSAYSQRGPFTRYIEDENFQILDTVTYGKGKRIKNYINAEPRIAMRYSLNSTSSIKFSYDKTYQYMHMAPLSSVSLPLDVWVPSSEAIKPQYAHQWSAGYFRNFLHHQIETSIVLYYKSMHNQIEYREGVIIGYSKGFNFDDNFVFGKGTSYGSEFSVRKNSGRLNGQVSYTLSKTTRKFDALNKGKSFPAKYDRLHDLSVITNFIYNPKWTFSCVFVYGTGNALNLPVGRYVVQGNVVNEYGERNSFRMPAYHRLDFSITYTAHKSERFESYLILSVYNLYSRRNPYYVYFETEGNLEEYELRTSIKQVSLFPVIPAITYRFKF